MSDIVTYDNDFLDAYMAMVEDTESPRVFHVWSALSGIAACLGRRCWTPFGPSEMYPNLFVVLTGIAASRKSTAMLQMTKLLQKSTGVRFAPSDTSGKKQGLVAMMANEDEDPDVLGLRKQFNGMAMTMEAIAGLQLNIADTTRLEEADRQHVYVAATEFTVFTGSGNGEFLQFLNVLYDGERYDYRLKDQKSKLTLDHPLLNIIGCTTATNIAEAFPASAIGQGFTSRIIFVHGSKKYKSVPEPTAFDEGLVEFICKRFSEVFHNFRGAFERSDAARRYATSIYEGRSELTDGRFVNYLSRRHSHFLKLGSVCAAARGSMMIDERDYILADTILRATERGMPDALGEYGMSMVSQAKQRIVEYINAAREPVTMHTLWTFMQRDLRVHEMATCLNELVSAGKIQQINRTSDGTACFIPKMEFDAETLDLMELISNGPSTGRIQ